MNTKNQTDLKPLIALILGFGLVILIFSLIFHPDKNFALGIVLGLILVFANFIFLIKIVVKFLDQNYTRTTFVILLIFFKLLFIVAILALAFKVLKVSVLAFGLGYLSFIPATLVYQMTGKTHKTDKQI